jgi:integrase
VDFVARNITVGKSKSESRTGRVIPLNARAFAVLEFWASLFPNRKPTDYVFPSEGYGAAEDDFAPCAYKTDPTKPIGRWKEAWEAARARAGVNCRFHDLRRKGCTRMLKAGTPFPVLAALMGWSPATTVRMPKGYGFIGHDVLRRAVESISKGKPEQEQPKSDQESSANPFDLNAEALRKAPN